MKTRLCFMNQSNTKLNVINNTTANNYNNNNYNNNNNNNSNKFAVMALPRSMKHSLPLPLLLLLLLLQWVSGGMKPVVAVAVNTTGAAATAPQQLDQCVVVFENAQVLKQIGDVWVSSQDPCAIHACELDSVGRAHESISAEDCGQFYCDVDSELRPLKGTCCGACVRTKCRYKDDVYAIGQSWHNKDDCTLLECAQLPDGEPMINAYEKTCPLLPADCPLERVYTLNCCQYCNNTVSASARGNDDDDDEFEVEVEDMWTEEFYSGHPCVRECQATEPPKTCHYEFAVEWYHTLSKACYNCPQNATDCTRPHCVHGDGIPRSITVVNRMMPGPAIEVCQNDLIVVDVKNELLGESTTIHWHGMHQKETPYMDGVPHISQCPISPHATFRYSFRAEIPGTHFWHSHTGMQRGDGVFGAFIIRRPRAADPHAHLYDFDLSEHKMILQDWVHMPGISMFADHHHSRGDNKPNNILINGRGRFHKGIWDLQKPVEQQPVLRKAEVAATVPAEVQTTTTAAITTAAVDESIHTLPQDTVDGFDFLYPLRNTGRISQQHDNAISRLVRLAKGNHAETQPFDAIQGEHSTKIEVREQAAAKDNNRNITNITSTTTSSTTRATSTTPAISTTSSPSSTSSPTSTSSPSSTSSPTSTSGAIPTTKAPANTQNSWENESLKLVRTRRTAGDYNVSLEEIPLQVYTVQQGFRYRFRIINAEFLNCPIAVSIDNHTMTAINSDGYDFEAVEVGSIVTYAGERFDFVLHANQSVGSYWVRLKGLMDCDERFTSAFQVAILRYEGAPSDAQPDGEVGYGHKAPGIELNTMNRGPGHVDTLTIAEVNSLPLYDTLPGINRHALKPVADYKFFVYYDFYGKNNPEFHPANLYGFNDSVSGSNRLFTPQLNHISLKFPSVALLPMRDQVDDSMFCNETSLEQQGIDCRKQFCKCHHVLQVPLGAVVELIIVDEGFTFDANHPFHLHGNAFRVVGLERLGANVTIEMVKQLDRYNLLKRNLVRPPIKDTVTIPDGGYTIVRFEAYNPGFWLFHCHIEFHAEIGMALILKVGDNEQMVPVPQHFPTCHDYMPDATGELVGDSTAGTGASPPAVKPPQGNSAAALWRSSQALVASLPLLYVLQRLLATS